MKKFSVLLMLGVALVSFKSYAQGVSVDDIDKIVRGSQTKSIMFMNNEDLASERRAIEAERERARAQAEAEAKAKAEAEKREKLKREQAQFRPYNLFGTGYKISAVVNGEMISNRDLQERANLFSLTTGIRANEKNKSMVINKVFQNTIDEKVKLQEAEKQGVRVSEKEINEAYLNFEKSNSIPRGKFANVLREYHVSRDVFNTQIKANLLWNKLVANKSGRNIDVSEREVQDEMARIKKDMNTPKYMVSEIVIKRKDGEHIQELVDILNKDPRFELYAAQFSQSVSAPSGGKLGWVAQGQLAQPLDAAIRRLKEGQVSQAIPYRTDFYIFKMNKIYDPKKEKQKMPTEDEVRDFIKNRKSDEIANKYIRDLRNRAVVEKKF